MYHVTQHFRMINTIKETNCQMCLLNAKPCNQSRPAMPTSTSHTVQWCCPGANRQGRTSRTSTLYPPLESHNVIQTRAHAVPKWCPLNQQRHLSVGKMARGADNPVIEPTVGARRTGSSVPGEFMKCTRLFTPSYALCFAERLSLSCSRPQFVFLPVI